MSVLGTRRGKLTSYNDFIFVVCELDAQVVKICEVWRFWSVH